MKRYIYIILCAVLLIGCTKDPIEDNGTPGDGKTITATFTLSPEIVEEIEVRSITGVDERLIKDLWVIQLNESGDAQLQEPQYITSLTAGPRDYKVAVPLVRSASRVYFIANTHDAVAYKGKITTADIEVVTMAVASEASIANTDGILMSAVWTGTPDLLGIAEQVSLSRAIAKANFKLDASLPKGESFLLTSVQIKQVPNKLHGYRDAATTGAFPISPTVINYDPTSYAKVNLTTANPQALWWYLPENARGTGTATVQGDKAKLFPTDQKDYCTYIEIVGDYLLGTGQGFKSTYKIYLGANNTTDYNLNRNTVYNVSTTIKGIDAADTRIENVVLTPLDYTDNGSAWFLIAPYDTQNPADCSAGMNWYIANGVHDATSNPNTLSACPAGWRVPTHMESSMMWIYKNAEPNIASISRTHYWTASELDGFGWRADMLSGFAYYHNISKSNNYILRCIKDAPLGAKYPYVGINVVGEARVIVSRDDSGGARSDAIHPNWSGPTPSHSYSDNTNSVSAKLEVAMNDCNSTNSPEVTNLNNTYLWANAILACSAYSESGTVAGDWRLPTQRELKLIWVMQANGELKTNSFGSTAYWTSTELSSTSTAALTVRISTGYADNNTKTVASSLVRCVRDVMGAKRPPSALKVDANGILTLDGKMLFFQFGSVVGFTQEGAWGTDKVLFNPVTGSPNYADYASIPVYTEADWNANRKNVSDAAYHNGNNVKAGKGDPCKLVGLSAEKIQSMTATELNAYNSGWRLPTSQNQCDFTGQTESVSYNGHWIASDSRYDKWYYSTGSAGGYFPKGSESQKKNYLPVSGCRTYTDGSPTAVGSTGYYWSSEAYNRTHGYHLYLGSTYVNPLNYGNYAFGFGTRCVNR